MDEGLTRLVASLPTDEAESKGKEAVTQGKNSLAAKLAASPVWLSLTLDAETFPSAGKQEYRPLMDWKVVAAAPLVIENQLPIKGTYLIWETPKDGGNMVMRQSGALDSRQRVHIYSADMRRSISLQFYPDGYDLVEPQPVPKSVTGEDTSTHNRDMGGPLARLPLSVQPGEVLVQIVDREQELMSTAGLQSLGGGAGLGRGGLDRELRIVPSRKGPNGELAVLGLASADDKSGNALYVSLSFGSLDMSCVDHLPEELIAVTIQGLSFSMAMGIGPEGTFQRMQLSLQNLQINDQLSASRFPVVLSPADIAEEASEYHPLLSLAVISQPGLARGQTYYPLISFQISKTLQISLSETLVWRAAEMVQRLDLTSLTAPEDEEHTEAATDVPMQMSLVSISSLAAKVSFHGDLAARPRWAGRTLSWALDMANFENVPVQLTGFEMENSTMLWSVFISEVGQNIKGQLVGVALSFLRNFGILSGASGVLGALSSGVASAALDDRFAVQRAQQKQERSIEGAGDGMVEGGAALGMGIYRGFTGLVTKPVEGAKSKGVGGFFKGVGKGVVGAIAQPISGGLDFASSAFEGIDASKDQLIGRPRAGSTNRRLRLPRAIGGDGKVTALLGSDGTEKEARVEEVGQALLRRTQDAGGVGPRRKGKRSRFHMDAYEELVLLPDDQVVILTNQCIMKLRAPGFAQVHRAAESGASPTTLMEVPPAEVRWAIPWQDLLTGELRWGNREGPYPDRLTVHRKGKPGQQEEEPLAHELRCWPNVPQADQIHLIALKVQRKYYNAEQPGSKEVLCVREDLCAKTGIFDSPIWKFEPPIMQGGLNVQRLKAYYPETWRCSCWQVDNPAGTFLANRSWSKPSNQAALSASGVPSK
ncbi:hypothetical protein WJX82_002022 [Trebouxia sp. C0006]